MMEKPCLVFLVLLSAGGAWCHGTIVCNNYIDIAPIILCRTV